MHSNGTKRNANVTYFDTQPKFSVFSCGESRFGCPRNSQVISAEELGTLSKNNLEGLPYLEEIYGAFTHLDNLLVETGCCNMIAVTSDSSSPMFIYILISSFEFVIKPIVPL